MNPDHTERIRQQSRWEQVSRAIPSVVRTILDTIDVPRIRNETMEEVERVLFAWNERRVTIKRRKVRVDQAGARATWSHALSTNRKLTLSTVCRLVDEAKEAAHLKKAQSHEVGQVLLPHHRAPEARDGILIVEPPQRRHPYFGLAGYLEATPGEIPVYVTRLWQKRTGKTSPTAWDATAGSNTVADVLRTVFGGHVFASDILNTDALDDCASISDLGLLAGHKSEPDLVFLDPPSRGRPTHSRIYNGAHPEADLASLDRLSYLHAVLLAVVTAASRVAPGGLVSLLLREGERHHQRATADETLVEEALGGLEDSTGVKLVERLQVPERRPINQASLGTTRYPMTHMLFERGGAS